MTATITAGVLFLGTADVATLLTTDPSCGQIAAMVRPRPRLTWIARDLIVALGGRYDGSVGEARDDRQWPMLAARLASDDITDVILLGIHHVGVRDLTDLNALIGTTSCRWWLIGDGKLGDRHIEMLTHLDVTIADDLHLPAPAQPSDSHKPAGPVTALPARLPRSDFPTFLTDCQRLLRREDADLVAARWQQHHQTAVEQWPVNRTLDAIQALLLDIVAGTTEVSDAIVAVRAFQAVAFDRNVYVQFNPDGLAASIDYIRPPAVSAREWDRLNAWVRPWRAAACALINTGAYPTDLIAARLSDVGATMHLRHHDRTVTLPPAVLRFVRRQELYRRRQGAGDADRLFAEGDRPIPHRTLADVASQAAVEHGVKVTAARTARKPATARSQARRLGIALHPIRKDAS